MTRIDETTVQFTPREMIANEFFNDQLDRGKDIPTAVNLLRLLMQGSLSEEFYEYLSK